MYETELQNGCNLDKFKSHIGDLSVTTYSRNGNSMLITLAVYSFTNTVQLL